LAPRDVAPLQSRDRVYQGRSYRLDAGFDLEAFTRLCGFRAPAVRRPSPQRGEQTEANKAKLRPRLAIVSRAIIVSSRCALFE